MSEIREHPWLGERIVAPIGCLNGLARQVIACHHEQWDGTGYPRGLRGLEIPLAARIFAVVDAYDSMTNVQPYREPLAADVALGRDRRQVGLALRSGRRRGLPRDARSRASAVGA